MYTEKLQYTYVKANQTASVQDFMPYIIQPKNSFIN